MMEPCCHSLLCVPEKSKAPCCHEGTAFFDALKAMVSRFLFLLHTLMVIWRVVEIMGSIQWSFCISLIGLLAETVVVLVLRKGHEWKWWVIVTSWWRHQMEAFSALLALCVRGIHRWIPLTKASDAKLWCFLWSICLNKRLRKQSRRRWFEAISRSLWRHCDDSINIIFTLNGIYISLSWIDHVIIMSGFAGLKWTLISYKDSRQCMRSEQNVPTFSKRHFVMHFIDWINLYLEQKFD